MFGGLIAGASLNGFVMGDVWPRSPQLYVVSIPNNIGVGKITNVTFIALGNGAAVNNTTIVLGGAASGKGVTDSNGMLVLPVNVTSNGSINVTASRSGYRNSTSFITATPGLVITTSPAAITAGTATFVTFSVSSIGKPVDSASVKLSGAGIALEGITNSEGQIILQVNAPYTGTIVATAKKAGYADDSTSVVSTGRKTLSVASSHSTLTVGLPTYVTFAVTAGGSAVNDVKVSLSGAAAGSGITNQDGNAIIQVNPQSPGTITISASGTGYSDGSATITSTGSQSLSVASNPSTITAGVPSYVLFTVKAGDNAIGEAAVALTGAAGGTGITNQDGQVILQINTTGAGTVTASASKAGYSNGTITLNVAGQQTLAVNTNPSNISNGVPTYVTMTVTGGGSAVSGATVSVSGGGINVDGVTNSAGQVTLLLNAAGTGTINVAARKAGYVDGTTTLAH